MRSSQAQFLRAGRVLFALLAAGARASGARASPAAAGAAGTAVLGTTTTVVVTLDNTGQPAVTAQLYEALEAPAPAAPAAAEAPWRVPLPDLPGPITPELTQQLEASPDAQADMLIFLADQADLSAAAALPDWNTRGAAVVATLQAHAARSQAPLLATLRTAGHQPRPYWIVNAVAVTGSTALAQFAAQQPGVALVAANTRHPLDVEEAGQPAEPGETITWGVDKIGAPSVWADWGVGGAGIVVANIDTGVAYTHTALLYNYRGWSPAGVDHNYNWFDAAGQPRSPTPADAVGHGTHTMGIAVGRAAESYVSLGVAPEARWIAVRGCDGLYCSEEALIASAQWILAPTDLAGRNPRPDLRPHVVNNSWGREGAADWYTGYVEAWNAAGIFSVFANGNGGSATACGTTSAPGNNPSAFAVGATDKDDIIAGFSSRGPTADNRIKPDLSAPGVNVFSAWLDGGLHPLSGTSMAAPHVTGAVALLWSANPTLIGNLPATIALLTSTAVPRTSGQCGPGPSAIPNNVYGWGRLNARQAMLTARVDVPWLVIPASVQEPANGSADFQVTLDARQVPGPGTYRARILAMRNNGLTSLPVEFTVLPAPNAGLVTGHLRNVWTGTPVYGRVSVGAGPSVQTDALGQYTVTLPYDDYTFTAEALGFAPASASVAVAGDTTIDFTLTPDLPHAIIASGAPFSATLAFGQQAAWPVSITNAGTRLLTVTASVPGLEWRVEADGVPAPPLFDLSGRPAMPLGDDEILETPLDLGFDFPIYGQLVRQLYLSSNGWVSAARPESAAAWSECLPVGSLPAGTLAPLWADLDPSQGGAIRAGQVAADTFVVSFENVPPWRETPDPGGPTYSFQLALHADGRVDFMYGHLPEMPPRWAAGVYGSADRAQSLGCFRRPVDLSDREWTLRNQPRASLWLGASPASLAVPPGATASLEAVLSGFGYAAWATPPYSGVLHLATNDPGLPGIDLPAAVTVGPAPYNWFFPSVFR